MRRFAIWRTAAPSADTRRPCGTPTPAQATGTRDNPRAAHPSRRPRRPAPTPARHQPHADTQAVAPSTATTPMSRGQPHAARPRTAQASDSTTTADTPGDRPTATHTRAPPASNQTPPPTAPTAPAPSGHEPSLHPSQPPIESQKPTTGSLHQPPPIMCSSAPPNYPHSRENTRARAATSHNHAVNIQAGRAQRRAQWPICIGSRGLVTMFLRSAGNDVPAAVIYGLATRRSPWSPGQGLHNDGDEGTPRERASRADRACRWLRLIEQVANNVIEPHRIIEPGEHGPKYPRTHLRHVMPAGRTRGRTARLWPLLCHVSDDWLPGTNQLDSARPRRSRAVESALRHPATVLRGVVDP